MWSSRPYVVGGINGKKQCHMQALASTSERATKQTAGVLEQDHDNSSEDLKNLQQNKQKTTYGVLLRPGRDRIPDH